MRVLVSKSELAKLRRRMLRAYPRERIELIWGKTVGKDEVHIYMFDRIEQRASRSSCTPGKTESEREIEVHISEQEAAKLGLAVIGSVHSHPDIENESAPSEFDFEEGVNIGELISGIVAVWKDKKCPRGARMRTRVKLWGPLVPVEMIIT